MKAPIVLALVAAAFSMTGTAHAAVKLSQGLNWAESTGTAVRAYDGEKDGNGVYAEYYLKNGGHGYAWDGNGADTNPGPWAKVGPITKFRVCEDHGHCSNWHTF